MIKLRSRWSIFWLVLSQLKLFSTYGNYLSSVWFVGSQTISSTASLGIFSLRPKRIVLPGLSPFQNFAHFMDFLIQFQRCPLRSSSKRKFLTIGRSIFDFPLLSWTLFSTLNLSTCHSTKFTPFGQHVETTHRKWQRQSSKLDSFLVDIVVRNWQHTFLLALAHTVPFVMKRLLDLLNTYWHLVVHLLTSEHNI